MLITLSGVTGIGKSYIKSKLIQKLSYKNLPNITTRPKREHEVDGIDKIFKTEEELDSLIAEGKIAYTFTLLGYRYAYLKEAVNSNDIYVTELHYIEIEEFKKACPNVFAVYLVSDDIDKIKEMLKDKNRSEADNNKRLAEIDDFNNNLELQKQFDLILKNDYNEISEEYIINAIKESVEK